MNAVILEKLEVYTCMGIISLIFIFRLFYSKLKIKKHIIFFT